MTCNIFWMMNKTPLIVLSGFALLGSVIACTPQNLAIVGGGAAYNAWKKDAGLLQKNYGAADYLAGRTRDIVSKDILILPKPLVHAENEDSSAPFGAIVMEQVASRFAELGYNVRLPGGTLPKDPPIAREIQNSITLGGTYLPQGYFLTEGDVKISLRMMDSSSGRVISAFDYFVPMTYNISKSVKDPPPPEPVVVEEVRPVAVAPAPTSVPVRPVPVVPAPAPKAAITSSGSIPPPLAKDLNVDAAPGVPPQKKSVAIVKDEEPDAVVVKETAAPIPLTPQ